MDRASPSPTGQLGVGEPHVSLLLASVPLMLQGTPVISGRQSVDAAFAFEGEACYFCIDAVRSGKGLSGTRNSREKNGRRGRWGHLGPHPHCPHLDMGSHAC